MNRSLSIFSNLSELSVSAGFGSRWYLDEPEMKNDYSSDLREPFRRTSYPDIDDDWSDEPSDDPVPATKASDSDIEENEKSKWRQSMTSPTDADIDNGAGSSSSASTGSRPIAIPRSRQNSSASAITLPEALSARGEMQGGYFPFHEDPKTRVRHPHPFYHDIKSREMPPTAEDVDTGADADVDMPKPRSSQYELSSSTKDDAYGFLSDDEDSEPFHSASLGKYYPSVYEKRHPHKHAARLATSASSSTRLPVPRPPVSKSTAPKTPKRRPRPRTPVIVPHLEAATEPIPPLKLESAE
ncbi:hypothetical protein TARUN_2562 [Trichoderma arundinaceum]|uniref:Uncharacterized protein n=1 Tax=Trichoderma arundinaceum TaxID=490622 RepID=A0A395NUX6_TRIAR|nr:hypothetical protein TARUN_2562 [Trichoderma arundinaceum]